MGSVTLNNPNVGVLNSLPALLDNVAQYAVDSWNEMDATAQVRGQKLAHVIELVSSDRPSTPETRRDVAAAMAAVVTDKLPENKLIDYFEAQAPELCAEIKAELAKHPTEENKDVMAKENILLGILFAAGLAAAVMYGLAYSRDTWGEAGPSGPHHYNHHR